MIGILLAAGSSLRFGKTNKLLHLLPNGASIGVTSATNLIDVLPVSIAVVQPDSQKLAEQLELAGLQVVTCTNEQGMAYSLAAATKYAAKLPEFSGGFIIALADMPFIRPASIKMVAKKLSQENHSIVLPTYQGSRGHPVGFVAKFRSELEKLQGDEGARSVVKSHQDEVHTFECDDPGILMDIDTQEDLAGI